MKGLLAEIVRLKNSDVRRLVSARMREFGRLGRGPGREIFKELCFCILTANFNAKGGMRIQREIEDGFLTLSQQALARRLKELGYRFPNTRARYIAEARKHADSLVGILKTHHDELELREWLVKNIKGLGYKEASHFMRNIGYRNVAIIDFHIIDLLERSGLAKRPKTLTRGRYLELEKILRQLAEKAGLSLAELDLYLWYLETGKVLK